MRKKWILFFFLVLMLQGMHALPSPVAHYQFNETGKAILDSVSKNRIELQGSVSLVPGGISGNCLSIAQKDDGFVSFGKAFGFLGDFSIALWMRTAPRYAPTESIILDRHSTDGSWNGYFLFINTAWGMGSPNKVAFYYTNAVIVSKSDINDGRWHHIGIVYRKNIGAELYIDGKLETKGPPPPIPMDTRPNVVFSLGAMVWDRAHGNFGGDLDDLTLFDVALSSDDIELIYSRPDFYTSADAHNLQAGSLSTTMKIQLREGRIITLPLADILKIEFGE